MINELKIEFKEGLQITDEIIQKKVISLNKKIEPLVDEINSLSLEITLFIKDDKPHDGYNISLPENCPEHIEIELKKIIYPYLTK